MSGFAVDPPAVKAHAGSVKAIGDTVADGAAAELAGIQQANFGMVVGSIVGIAVLGVATNMQSSLAKLSESVAAAATALDSCADLYAGNERDQADAILAAGAPMTDLVAEEESPSWSEGAAILDDGNSLWSDISDGSELDAVFNVGGTAIDVLSAIIDPLGGVISCAVGWAFDHISFLREPVDMLAGDAASIDASAQTWANVSAAMGQAAGDYRTALNSLTSDKWSGSGRDLYQKNATGLIGSLNGSSTAAAVEGAIITATGELCAAFRGMIIERISEFAEKMAIRGLVALANSTWTFGGAIAAWVIDLEAEGAILAAKIESQIARLISKASKILERLGKDGGKLEKISKDLEKVAKKLEDNARKLCRNATTLRGQATRVRNGTPTSLNYVRDYQDHIGKLSELTDSAGDAIDTGKTVVDTGKDGWNLATDPSATNLNSVVKDVTGKGVDIAKNKLTDEPDAPDPHGANGPAPHTPASTGGRHRA